ncbi:prolyl oligopeptidase family serine peptidase [Salinicoccus sesuvii]|uniref:Prolyl oligopeptidase family serine peptidase n=1 Tax=Salinicoccus sesuvii TaxID=868281 RepID=A0ABV7N376_9STAP
MNLKYCDKKRRLYFISNESGMHQLWEMDIADQKKRKVTSFSQNTKNFWIEANHIVVATDYNGNERNQYHKLDSRIATEITSRPDYFHYYGKYKVGEDSYIVIRNHYEHSTFELCKMEGQGNIEVIYVFSNPIHFIHELSTDRYLLSMDVDNIDQILMIFDKKSGEPVVLPLPKARFSAFKFIRDTCFCLCDIEDGYKNIYEIDINNGRYKKRTFFKWDIEHFKLFNDNKEAMISCNEDGFSKLYRLNLTTWEVVQLPFNREGVIHSLAIRGQQEVFLIYSSVDQPHLIYCYDLDQKSFKVMAGNEACEPISFKTASYPSFDGTQIPYFIYESESDMGAVIHIHGGPESQSRPEFNTLYYLLNKTGLCVAVPNIRGSMGYGRPYLEADDKEKRLDAMKDVVELRRHLIKTEHADASRVSVMGRSYGGLMTLLLVTHQPSLWRAAVDIVGLSDLGTFFSHTPPWRRRMRAAEYGSMETHGSFLKDISPLSRSRQITAPLMIFHSHHDSRVPYTESKQMAEVMEENGQDVTFTVYDNEGHTFMHRENLEDMHHKIANFLTTLHEKK